MLVLSFFQHIKFIFIVSIITVGIFNLFFPSFTFAQSPSLSSLKENKSAVYNLFRTNVNK